jgi:sugar lactone lactonase YvrE
MLALAALLLTAIGARAQSVFATPQPVGTTSGQQTVTVKAQVAGSVAAVRVLTFGTPNLDFAAGTGASACGSAILAAGATCTESVTFTPASPGLRMGAVVLLDGAGRVLGTQLISGTGLGGLGVFIPGIIQTVAGDGQWVSVQDGGLATTTDLDLPSGVALDGAGNLYIADSAHNRIREVAASTGIISTVAGNGNGAFGGDGGLSTAAIASLNTPSRIALDGAGNLYIADTGNNRIRMITAATGIITTVAGNGAPGSPANVGDGSLATAANLNSPGGITLDLSGNLYIADTGNHRIRKVDSSTGIITTVAGIGFMNGNGSGGYSGDGVQASLAELNFPFAVAFDSLGNMYIPDSTNHRIREVTAVGGVISASSIISTFAGNGTAGFSGDGGAAISAKLNSPSGVVFDSAGNLYIADTQNERIRKVSSTTQNITTIAGNGGNNYGGDNGSAVVASIYGPYGIALDGKGNLFIADYFNHRIREVQSNLALLSFTLPVRQGSTSTPQDQTVENDGSGPLDLTAIAPDLNAKINDTSVANPCAIAPPSLPENGECAIGAVFAPSPSLVFPAGVTSESLTANIGIGKLGDTANSPLDIELVGVATAVNSTTITVSSSLNPSGFGQNVTFTANLITGASTGNLTGTVSFFDNATSLKANVALNAPGTTATATFATPALTVGLHTITASYSGDATHFAATSTDNSALPLIQTVNEGTATGLVSSLNPSPLGQNVTFTATVTAPNGGGVVPDGTIVFYDSTAILGTPALNASGVATLQTAALTTGLHSITAYYGGDAPKQIQGSTSNTVPQDVQASSTVAVISSGSPSIYGTSVIFTATVTPNGTVAATGAVNFLDRAAKIGTGTLNAAGQAMFTISSLAVGSHTITAAYQGDTNYNGTTSPAITQTVTQAITSTTVAAFPNPGIAGRAVALTATVQVIAGAGTATGTITFTDGGAPLGTATLSGTGTATINPILSPGTHSIVASYGGDINDGTSISAAYPLAVILATTQTAVSATPSSALVLAPVTIIAKVTGNGGIPTGSVTFLADNASIGTATVDATGTATFTTSALVAGSHALSASYSGDANDSPSASASVTETVGTIPTVTDLGTSTTSGANLQVILVATVVNNASSTGSATLPTPTGAVTFTSGSTVVGASTLNSSGIATLVPNLATGTYDIIATYSGDAQHSPSTSNAVQISTVAAGFNLTVTPASVTMATTQNATVTVALSSDNGFADTIGLGCASLPAGVTCHFSSISAALAANGVQSVQLTIDTNNPLSGGTSAMNSHTGNRGAYLAGLLLPFSLFFGWTLWSFRKRHAAILGTVLVLLLSGAAMLSTGCSGMTSSSAAPGTYVIQVTGSGANSNIIHYQNVTLTITK